MSNFRERLESNSQSNQGGNGDLKVINMQSKKNYGSVVFVPFTPADGSDSIAILNDVMEVMEHYTYKDSKTKVESKGQRFIKLLNREDYGTLNADQKDTYKDLRSMGKTLHAHKFSKNQKDDRTIKNSHIRFKNYTILVGWLIEHRSASDNKIINKSCPACLVFSSRNFDAAFNDALKAKDKKAGSSEWEAKLFNNNLKKSMYLFIDYKLSEDKSKIGYIASVSIEKFDDETVRYTDGNVNGLDLTSHEDKLKELPNPIRAFVGLTNGSLFNEKIIARLTERLHELLNKYCGGTYELKDGKKVKTVATKDPLDYVKKDKDEDLPPEDVHKDNKDEWE